MYFKCHLPSALPRAQDFTTLVNHPKVSSALVLSNPPISHPRKKRNWTYNQCPFSTKRRAKELTRKNKSLQPGATEDRMWVRWTDGFRMPPCTLPRVTSRSPILTDVWNMLCVWDPFTPRMRESIWPEIESGYMLCKNIIKWMFRNH